jgi:hypothetical protein
VTLVARVTFLVLVGASFSAFFVAQRLKSTPAIIDVGSIARYFSPNGDGQKDVNHVSIRLRVSDDATIDVVNLDGDRVKRLGENVPMKAYRPLRLDWDGSTDAGGRAPDGQYRIRVALRNEGRSATIQKTTLVDTKAPQPVACIGFKCANTKEMGNVISQGDRRVPIYVRGVSRSQTGFTLYRTDQGKPRKIASLPPLKGGFTRKIWDGLVDNKPLDPGTYLVQVRVRDRAGNVGVSPAEFEVGTIRGRPGITVRGLAAQPPLRPVTEGQRVEFHVDARGAAYHWRVRRVGDSAVRKRGTETAAVLAFRAPTGPSGVYLLELRSGRWHTTVPFLVQAEKRSSVLVVVPAVTWLGTDKVDDRPFDGLPNTLNDGGTVRWPRAFVGDDGLPADFATQIAPLLVFLDRQRIRYDLTSDLDLDLTRNPRASDRPGVLFAGSERWITRTLAKRLRRYVTDGGHVALFGGDTMLRGVRLRVFDAEDSGTLSRATQPTSTDPFGARIGKARTLPAPATLSQFEGSTEYGLMEGANDLPGFKVLPALAATQLGKGVVIRVGLPEWTSKLSDSNVSQVTRNIIDILRGVQPRIRSTK